jgi:hypothetical protein
MKLYQNGLQVIIQVYTALNLQKIFQEKQYHDFFFFLINEKQYHDTGWIVLDQINEDQFLQLKELMLHDS